MAKKIYIAARYSSREEIVVGVAETLMQAGHDITSRWLQGQRTMTMEEIADADLEDIESADVLVLVSSEGNSGGRHVEMGYALGWGIPVYVLGERENIFHYHPDVTWVRNEGELLEALE